jgi:hypothetical protein
MLCWLITALSVTVSVALRELFAAGLKTTLIEQVAFRVEAGRGAVVGLSEVARIGARDRNLRDRKAPFRLHW